MRTFARSITTAAITVVGFAGLGATSAFAAPPSTAPGANVVNLGQCVAGDPSVTPGQGGFYPLVISANGALHLPPGGDAAGWGGCNTFQ